jgi:hypothetical protein
VAVVKNEDGEEVEGMLAPLLSSLLSSRIMDPSSAIAKPDDIE